jgi:hypothetical protein
MASDEPSPIAPKVCECGWPRPLIAVTLANGAIPTEDLRVRYDCPQCARPYLCGEISRELAAKSPRARRLVSAAQSYDARFFVDDEP